MDPGPMIINPHLIIVLATSTATPSASPTILGTVTVLLSTSPPTSLRFMPVAAHQLERPCPSLPSDPAQYCCLHLRQHEDHMTPGNPIRLGVRVRQPTSCQLSNSESAARLSESPAGCLHVGASASHFLIDQTELGCCQWGPGSASGSRAFTASSEWPRCQPEW